MSDFCHGSPRGFTPVYHARLCMQPCPPGTSAHVISRQSSALSHDTSGPQAPFKKLPKTHLTAAFRPGLMSSSPSSSAGPSVSASAALTGRTSQTSADAQHIIVCSAPAAPTTSEGNHNEHEASDPASMSYEMASKLPSCHAAAASTSSMTASLHQAPGPPAAGASVQSVALESAVHASTSLVANCRLATTPLPSKHLHQQDLCPARLSLV